MSGWMGVGPASPGLKKDICAVAFAVLLFTRSHGFVFFCFRFHPNKSSFGMALLLLLFCFGIIPTKKNNSTADTPPHPEADARPPLFQTRCLATRCLSVDTAFLCQVAYRWGSGLSP